MENVAHLFRVLADIWKGFKRVKENTLKHFRDILMLNFSLKTNINPKADLILGCDLRSNKRSLSVPYLESIVLPQFLKSPH